MKLLTLFIACLALASSQAGGAEDIARLVAARTAIERVYHSHRTGTKVSFEAAAPASAIEQMVSADLKKEAVLARTYGTHVTADLIRAEQQRIETTTRAPDVLAEIKAALGGDSALFAAAFVRPIVAERLLRARFQHDAALHAAPSSAADAVCARLLEQQPKGIDAQLSVLRECRSGEVHLSVRWLYGAEAPATVRPQVITAGHAEHAGSASASYSNEATAELAQTLGSAAAGAKAEEDKLRFCDLPDDLRQVLRTHLHKPGDVSPVVDSPSAFQVFVARECGTEFLTAAVVTFPKRSYDEWLAQQPN
ncbi:MAG: hypothetical protein K1X78_13725 [Verrucomicrobiaceae bacterium]|nr:hypothetical protein [Verrucomicrobiaceae bacterium]